jgi:hypothetical protein
MQDLCRFMQVYARSRAARAFCVVALKQFHSSYTGCKGRTELCRFMWLFLYKPGFSPGMLKLQLNTSNGTGYKLPYNRIQETRSFLLWTLLKTSAS